MERSFARMRNIITALAWVDIYTTESVWDEETRAGVPGTEAGPMAEEPEVAGEQGSIDHVLPDRGRRPVSAPAADR